MARTFTDDLASDVANAFLRDFSESIVRYALGDSLDSSTVTATVDMDREDGGMSEQGRDRDGKRIVRHGLLHIATTIEVDDRDTWLIRGEVWKTVRVVSRDSALQVVAIKLVIPIDTQRPRINR